MFSLNKGIDRRTYFLAGTALFAVKIVLELLLSQMFSRPYSLLFYISPMRSPLLQPGDQEAYWLAMWALALPFIAIGLALTIRRLVDAGLSPAYAVLFFVPFANLLFFLTCATLPTAEEREAAESRAGRRRSFARALWITAAFASVAGLGCIVLSVFVFRGYGGGLLIGTPVILGFLSGILFARLHKPSYLGALLASLAALLISGLILVSFAWEGSVCILMSAPLMVPSALIGALAGFLCSRRRRGSLAAGGVAMVLLPLLIVLEGAYPLPLPEPLPVTSEVIIDAAPAVVWSHVIAFPPLPEPREWIFRAGIAAPMGARIIGKGPGATRLCDFTTGSFVEPIETWKPGEELTFSVTAQPDPMRELTLWDGPPPPHLEGYLQSTRGQFLLEELPGGRTRLIGRTWYRTNMVPEAYWRLWGDGIIHTIHLRVLDHVKRLAEADGGLRLHGTRVSTTSSSPRR